MTRRVRAGLALTAIVLVAAITTGQVPSRLDIPTGPVVKTARHDRSPRLRDIKPIPPSAGHNPWEREPAPRHRGRGARGFRVDTVVQDLLMAPSIPDPSESFGGIGNVNNVLPPDTTGDIGPNHFVQWVNLSFAVYSKGTPTAPPTLLYGPVDGSTLWSGFGGPCEGTNNGDPIVIYDHLADRWVMSQLAVPNSFFGLLLMAPFYQCVAVSATPDPLGAYYRYQFEFDKLNDYPKIGLWSDAYYMAINQFTEITLEFAGQGVVAFDRASMLAGQPASMVYIDLASRNMNLGGMLPADLDGPPPPAGSPGYFVQVDDDAWGYASDQLQLWRFNVDWSNPAASTFTGPSVLPTAPFDSDMCGYARNCLPQPGTGVLVDAMADRLMYRLQYRNFGDHEALVVNHTVDADGNDHAGIRWYEIRDPQTSPFIYQQSTYAPDGDHRWMGSAAMDRAGNLALGFSVTGATTFPSIRYAGRLATDPLGVLAEGETTLVAGSGSQTHTAGRWGDYSMMAVDPGDDCTFWYTQEYYTSTSTQGWRTHIGVFSYPSCDGTSGVPRVTIAATTATAPESGPSSGLFTVTRTGDTAAPMTVFYSVGGTATPGIDYAALSDSVTISAGASTAPISVTAADDAVYEGNETVLVTLGQGSGYRIGSPGSAVVTLVDDETPPDLIVSAIAAPANGGAGATITVTDTTRNQGAGSASASSTGFYLSTNTTLDLGGDVFLGERPVPPLGPSASGQASTALPIPEATTAGTYYVIARTDVNGVIIESQEGNNTAVSGAVKIGNDLVVTALTVPSAAAAGSTITVSDTTSNQGGGGAPASGTKFYLSTNTLLEASDVVLGSRSVAALAPGATNSGSVQLTVPLNTASGLVYVLAKADGDNVISELQENNNVRTSPAVKIGPDLTATGLTAPATAAAGGTISVSDTTKNQGAAAAASSNTTYYLSANAIFDTADVLLGGRPVPSLDAGAVHSGSASVQIPAGTSASTYYLLARADGSNAVAECLENNNVSSAVVVRVGADLIVSGLTAPTAASANTMITVTDTTRNQGASAAPDSTTVVYLSANALLDAADPAVGQRSVPSLSAGGSHTGSSAVQIPAGTPAGTFYLIAKADGSNTVAEGVETNNSSSSVALRIGPDLVVSSFSAPGTAAAGDSITVSDTTKNAGAEAALGSATVFYLSINALLDTSDIAVGARPVPSLAAGASDLAQTSLQIPAGTAAGTYYLFAKADGSNAVAEAAETNNGSTAAIVRVGPDLTVSALTAPNGAAAGSAISVIDTTINQGSGAAPASNTRFYLSLNSLFDAGDVLTGARSVPALGGGASDTATTAVTIPAGTVPRGYYLLAVADGDGLVVEASDTNNTRIRFIQVTGS
jgi:subtilase family serine protease